MGLKEKLTQLMEVYQEHLWFDFEMNTVHIWEMSMAQRGAYEREINKVREAMLEKEMQLEVDMFGKEQNDRLRRQVRNAIRVAVIAPKIGLPATELPLLDFLN